MITMENEHNFEMKEKNWSKRNLALIPNDEEIFCNWIKNKEWVEKDKKWRQSQF